MTVQQQRERLQSEQIVSMEAAADEHIANLECSLGVIQQKCREQLAQKRKQGGDAFARSLAKKDVELEMLAECSDSMTTELRMLKARAGELASVNEKKEEVAPGRSRRAYVLGAVSHQLCCVARLCCAFTWYTMSCSQLQL